MLKRGIKDFAYRIYDRELVNLENDWLNGEHDTLSLGFQAGIHCILHSYCERHFKNQFENLSK